MLQFTVCSAPHGCGWGVATLHPWSGHPDRRPSARASRQARGAPAPRRTAPSAPAGGGPARRRAPGRRAARLGDVRLAAAGVVGGVLAEHDLGRRVDHLLHHLGQLQHRELGRVADVERARVRAVHDAHHACRRAGAPPLTGRAAPPAAPLLLLTAKDAARLLSRPAVQPLAGELRQPRGHCCCVRGGAAICKSAMLRQTLTADAPSRHQAGRVKRRLPWGALVRLPPLQPSTRRPPRSPDLRSSTGTALPRSRAAAHPR